MIHSKHIFSDEGCTLGGIVYYMTPSMQDMRQISLKFFNSEGIVDYMTEIGFMLPHSDVAISHPLSEADNLLWDDTGHLNASFVPASTKIKFSVSACWPLKAHDEDPLVSCTARCLPLVHSR